MKKKDKDNQKDIDIEIFDNENFENVDAEEQDELDAVSEYNDTSAQIDEMETKLEESEDKYRRLFAEYDNYRKRTSKEKTEAYGNATAKSVEAILPIIDSFERAVEVECSDDTFKDGMIMIFNQFKDILTKMNVVETSALGDVFDPNVHNAISKVDSEDYESGTICQIYQKGYLMGDRLIRPAMVAVAN